MSMTHLNLNPLRLSVARANAKMSLQDLTKKAGCHPRYLKNNPVRVTVLAAGRIANALGVDLEWLLDEDQED